jgi:hypothetical protein
MADSDTDNDNALGGLSSGGAPFETSEQVAALGDNPDGVFAIDDDINRHLGLTRAKHEDDLMQMAIDDPQQYIGRSRAGKEAIYGKVKTAFTDAFAVNYDQLGNTKAASIEKAKANANAVKSRLMAAHDKLYKYDKRALKVMETRGR